MKKVVDPSSIPEVQAFLEADKELEEFLRMNEHLHNRLLVLSQKRNNAIVAAMAKVREQQVNCGPFTIAREVFDVNAEKLHEEVGEEAFKKLGGYIEHVIEYKVDKPTLRALVFSGQLPEEVISSCIKTAPAYSGPPTYTLPLLKAK